MMGLGGFERSWWAQLVYKIGGPTDHPDPLINSPQITVWPGEASSAESADIN